MCFALLVGTALDYQTVYLNSWNSPSGGGFIIPMNMRLLSTITHWPHSAVDDLNVGSVMQILEVDVETLNDGVDALFAGITVLVVVTSSLSILTVQSPALVMAMVILIPILFSINSGGMKQVAAAAALVANIKKLFSREVEEVIQQLGTIKTNNLDACMARRLGVCE
jgi:ABC-type multidrug transport system fused ATPase/permease subunit